MKKKIHPEYNKIIATCSCGYSFKIRSTIKCNISLDVCGHCHPFYVGKQKALHDSGRVSVFKKKFGILKIKK